MQQRETDNTETSSYQLSEAEIDFIIDDIRARGIEMESLQHDLVDHICCLIERNPEAKGDFRRCYTATVATFFREDLKEIEAETKLLLINKHYYNMKKSMLISGVIATVLLTTGIILKFLHMPGAAIGIFLGIVLFSLVFLPLMFTFKAKEQKSTRDKILSGIGTVAAIIISMSALFKIQHWPYANMMGMTGIAILLLVYLPYNFFSGIRKSDTKLNTVMTSILLIAGCGLFLSLVRSPQSSLKMQFMSTENFLRNEQILHSHPSLHQNTEKANIPYGPTGREILAVSEELKEFLLQKETGQKSIDFQYEKKQAWIGDTFADVYLDNNNEGVLKLIQLNKSIASYNEQLEKSTSSSKNMLPVLNSETDLHNTRVIDLLNSIIQIELMVLNNE